MSTVHSIVTSCHDDAYAIEIRNDGAKRRFESTDAIWGSLANLVSQIVPACSGG